ncbi:hypothetical protein Vretimale_1533 [Volvox reticuliferus]|uniref:Uncharacterized protein n=1 Tax=Volvox reticuliferus TaxID=1737510 RepID=A0A8J4CFK0_9CHLO|nr:hypothetical protein Vretifemale_10974 [Volvox reticuliferus]GIL95577.1 hypothetical protein Vretimale_1533 [Volvox reticuliferus]
MESLPVDPSALTFTEKKTLFSSISSADHGTPQVGRLPHNTSLALSSFRHQLEYQYPKYLTASAANRVRLASAKLFGEAAAPGTRAAAFGRLDRQQSHKLILEVATQTESFSPAATVAAQHSNPPDSPDAVALLWLPGTSAQTPAEANNDQANSAAMKDTGIMASGWTGGRDQSAGSHTLPGLVADLLSQFVADCAEKGISVDPRVSEALRAAQLSGEDLITLPAVAIGKNGDVGVDDDAATQQNFTAPSQTALSIDQSSRSCSAQDDSAAACCTSPSDSEARTGTASATSSGVGVGSVTAAMVSRARDHQVDSLESSKESICITALQEQVRQLRLQLQQHALAQYDANRTLGAALRRSLFNVQDVIASAAMATAAPPSRSKSGCGVPVGPPAAPGAAAAATSDIGLMQQLWVEQRRRTELSGMCSRLERQCQGLLSYISLLSGNGCASVVGNAAASAMQQKPATAPPCMERVRVRLVLLPAQGAWKAWAAGREGAEGCKRQEDQVDREESDDDGLDGTNVARGEPPVRVKVQLVVRRTSALAVPALARNSSEHPALCRWAASGLSLSPYHILKTATLQPIAEAPCADAAATGVREIMAPQQQRISAMGLMKSAADAAAASGFRSRQTQPHVAGWNGAPHRGHETQADTALSAAVRQLVAAVEDQTAAAVPVAATGSNVARLAVSPVSQSILDGLRGVLRQLRYGSDGGAAPGMTTESGVCAAQPTSPRRNSNGELQLQQLMREEALPQGDAAAAAAAAPFKPERLIAASATALAQALPLQQTETVEAAVGESLSEDGVLSGFWARRAKSAPVSAFAFTDTGGDQIPYNDDNDFYEVGSEQTALEDSPVCGGGNRRMHERLTTPPCSPRTSRCTPFASMDEDDLHGEGSGLGPCSAATATVTGGDGSGSGSGCYFDAEYGSRGDWYGDEESYLDLEDVDELAVAAAVNGPAALLSAVRVLREQLLQAHLEIVKLSTQLVAVSHQREGLRAQASQRDAALQLVAINEGDALLEAERLRAQLASERAARARLSAQYDDLRTMLSLGVRDGPLGAHNPYDHPYHSHNHSHHSGSLQRLSHGHYHGLNQNLSHQACDVQQLQQLLLQHQEHQNQRGTLPPRHRSAPRHRPTGAFSARAACDTGAVVGSQSGPTMASVLLSSR